MVAPCAHADPSGLVALEAVAGRFPTLEAFLKDKGARKEYEAALTRYFGSRHFPCETFDDIVAQVRRWIEADPAVAERLWTSRPTTALGEVGPRWRFVKSARAFHDVWVDLSRAACSESRCPLLGVSLPGRWAAVLRGSELHHLEKGGRYGGASLVVLPVSGAKGNARFVAVAPRSILDSSLLETWAKSAGKGDPLVRLGARDDVVRVPGSRKWDRLASVAFRDPFAEKLASFIPEKCAKEARGLSGKGGAPGKSSAVGGADGVGVISGGSPPKAAALKDLLLYFNLPLAVAAAPGENKVRVEAGLQKELAQSPDPQKRALAALALGLMGQLEAGPPIGSGRFRQDPPGGFLGTFGKGARSALIGALRDASPAVRSHAALAISDAGGVRVSPAPGAPPTPYAPLPKELAAVKPQLQSALNQTFVAPPSVTLPSSPSVVAETEPKSLGEKAFDGIIRNAVPLEPKSADKIREGFDKSAALEARREAVRRVAELYLQKPPTEALNFLQNELAIAPGIRTELLSEIDRKLFDFCEECRAKNLIP